MQARRNSNPEGDTLRGVPEIFEEQTFELLAARAAQQSKGAVPLGLGLPDVIVLMKTNKAKKAFLSSYHFISGLDASSSASIAVYFNTLRNQFAHTVAPSANSSSANLLSTGTTQNWFSSAKSQWVISRGIVNIYNCFTRRDIAVDITVPGGVDSYTTGSKGERIPVSQLAWKQARVSSFLRTIYPPAEPLAGLRRIQALANVKEEQSILDDVISLYDSGEQLGMDESGTMNVLAAAMLEYFKQTRRWHIAIQFYNKLIEQTKKKNPSHHRALDDLLALRAHSLFMLGEEARAIRSLHQALTRESSLLRPSPLALALQAGFLLKKKELDQALLVARYAVETAPMIPASWLSLAEAYVALGNCVMGLVALNGMPMDPSLVIPSITYPEVPVAKRWANLGTDFEMSDEDLELDEALDKLDGGYLAGPMAKAYKLLAEMVKRFGWDKLLRARTAAFHMQDSDRSSDQSISRIARHPPRQTIMKSSSISSLQAAAATASSSDGQVMTPGDTASIDSKTKEGLSSDANLSQDAISPTEEKPSVAFTLPEETRISMLQKELNATSSMESIDLSPAESPRGKGKTKEKSQKSSSLRPKLPENFQKRISERWLDELFQILYEDMRVYTAVFQPNITEATQRKPLSSFGFNALEYRVVGDLAFRLLDRKNAIAAYAESVAITFSRKSWDKLIAIYEEEGETDKLLHAASVLASAGDCNSSDALYPGVVSNALLSLLDHYRSSASKAAKSSSAPSTPLLQSAQVATLSNFINGATMEALPKLALQRLLQRIAGPFEMPSSPANWSGLIADAL